MSIVTYRVRTDLDSGGAVSQGTTGGTVARKGHVANSRHESVGDELALRRMVCHVRDTPLSGSDGTTGEADPHRSGGGWCTTDTGRSRTTGSDWILLCLLSALRWIPDYGPSQVTGHLGLTHNQGVVWERYKSIHSRGGYTRENTQFVTAA
jgi:hypothetical protein